MPITVIVGGQYGSEGKGKTAFFYAKMQQASIVVRVGGVNSGHTVVDKRGHVRIFQQLPTACLLPNVKCVLPAGSYIHQETLTREMNSVGLDRKRLLIDPNAMLIENRDIQHEKREGLVEAIGSTASGTGAAIIRRVARNSGIRFASDVPELRDVIGDVRSFMRKALQAGERIVLEGTQGFGLSLLHSNVYPFTTSRDTTAASCLSESGLSPLDIDCIVLVVRAFPIRVAGNSGPLPREINWNTITIECGSAEPIIEYTTVTRKVRRVARFDSDIVKQAIICNNPTDIVLNHLDYIDTNKSSKKISVFVRQVEKDIGRDVAWLGFDRVTLVSRKCLS